MSAVATGYVEVDVITAAFVRIPDSELARLTDVKIRILDMDELPRLLRLSPNLPSLLMFDIENLIKIESPGPVMHANLQYLTVHGHLFNDDDMGHGLFNAITLPNLRLRYTTHASSKEQ
ncbi:hypothetical protein P692DRAFT_20877615 [Suillus brevipes Sb2]|nr:hypothetical protein P692DRAFT_20877615 [Suillus brevipes Sb2]